ncbi:MAG TPA: hypothetical protein PLU80_05135 [Acidobacteriota bacterium]|nr:hypothetical protein [Acidobacteriota bacterium]HNC43524.1 hypothetical protein [Acidobacteriota bacterium]
MINIRWSTTAFASLEVLPRETAFAILDRTDKLPSFPELGVSLQHQFPQLGNCRQLIFNRIIRIVYVYDDDAQEIRILLLQHCRQQLPTLADLHRSLTEIRLEDTKGE